MILSQITARLSNVFSKYCKDPLSAATEAEEIIDDLYKSLGGCEQCYGRGYLLLGDETYQFCACKRGKSLEKFIENR